MLPVKRVRCLVGVVALAVLSHTAHSREAFSADFSYQRFTASDPRETRFAVGDIEEGEGATLDLVWRASDRWYARGTVGNARLRYADRQNPGCPTTTGIFIRPGFFCIAEGTTATRDGLDSAWTSSVRIGRRFPVTDRWTVFGELGVTRLEWTSDTDLEARALTQCRLYGPDSTYETSIRNVDCIEIAKQASANGLSVRAGAEARLWARVIGRIVLAYEGDQYEIFRNDVIPRFVSANCPDTFNCAVRRAQFADRSRDGSATWVRAELELPMTSGLSLVLAGEGAGTRAWGVFSAGVRWDF